MRAALVLVLMSAVSAHAAPSRAQVEAYGLDPELVPAACRGVVTGTVMGARISVASCASKLALEHLSLDDSAASIAALQRAVRWPTELLDSVIAAGTPIERAEALRAEADQLDGMVARLRRTAPNLSWHTTGRQLASAEGTHDSIETAIEPWVRAAAAANDTIIKIANQHPEVRQDPIAAIAVRSAEAAVRARVATR